MRTAFYASCTAFFGAVMASMAKLTGERTSSCEKIIIRSVLCIVISPLLTGSGFASLVRSRHKGWLAIRSCIGFFAVVSYLEAIKSTPLAFVALMTRLHPLFGAALARLLVGEELLLQQVAGLVLGSVGASLAAPPGTWVATHPCSVGFSWAFAATFLTSLSFLALRKLSELGEDMATVQAACHLAGVLGGLCFGGQTLVVPTGGEFACISALATATSGMLWGLSRLYQVSAVVDPVVFFFPSVVFNTTFGLLQGEALPTEKEARGAAIILTALVVGTFSFRGKCSMEEEKKSF